MGRAAAVAIASGVLAIGVASAARAGRDDDDKSTRSERRAKDAVLTLDDVPAGWRATDTKEQAREPADRILSEIESCRASQRQGETRRKRPGAASPLFVNSESATYVDNDVRVYRSKREARKALSVLSRDDTRECLTEFFPKSVAANNPQIDPATIETSVGPMSVDPLGDDVAAIQIETRFLGTPQVAVTQQERIRVGATVVTFVFTADFGNFDPNLRLQLINVVLDRLGGGSGKPS